MTRSNEPAQSQERSVSLDIELKHPPEKVWRALTDPALLAEWLLPVVGFELEPGAAFRLQAPPQPGWDGTVRCRMLEIEAQQRLRYAWVVGDMEIDTEVTFTLTPTPSGTLLSVVQAGFKPDQKREWGGARYGWRMMSERLVDLLDRLP